jgi:hypothetical protein
MELNAVEQRLVALQYRWQNFLALDDKRMLLWQFKENALRLAETFIKVQQEERLHEKPYACNETFIVFDQPFDHSTGYAKALKKSLAAHYDASREAIERVGGTADWQYAPDALPDSPQVFVQSLNALAQHHKALLRTLVAVIMPATIASETAWTDWLGRALRIGLAPQLRLIVIDRQEHPRCLALAESAHPQLQVDPVPIDAIDLAAETFAQEPAAGAAGVFRNLLTGLFNLVDKGTPEQVKLKAADAIEYARGNNMPDQEVVVRLMTAGALLKAKNFDEAVTHYQHARLCAEKLMETDHPAAQDLVLQGWFGEASAHFAANKLPETIHCYQEAASVAEAIPKPILWIESLRMGAYCHRLNGDDEGAIQCCERALQVAEQMRPEARIVTTLPLVGMELLHLLDNSRTRKMERIKTQLDTELTRHYDEMEQAAILLEQEPDSQKDLQALELQLQTQSETEEQTADQKIIQLVRAADPLYIKAFEYLRSLLWETWPLDRPESLQEEKDSTEPELAGGARA